MKFIHAFTVAALAAKAAALAIGGKPIIIERGSDDLQDILCPYLSITLNVALILTY